MRLKTLEGVPYGEEGERSALTGMLVFGSGMSTGATADEAGRQAAAQAYAAFHRSGADDADRTPKLAIVFASVAYDDADRAIAGVRELVGTEVPVVGGSSGACVLGPKGVAARGVSVVLLGGDAIEVRCEIAEMGSPELVDVVPAAARIARAAEEASGGGREHFACLVFAPGIFVDGEALVAAVRKGAGAGAQLAGCLTGDELTMDRPKVYAGDQLRGDRIVLTGLFTRTQVGIAARHGWQAVGPSRTVTRAEGPVLLELDHRPALDVWLEDARAAGATPPTDHRDLTLYLANHYELGLESGSTPAKCEPELVARAPFSIGDGGAVTLSASIGEGRRVRVVHASRKDLLRASTDAAAAAALRAGNPIAGALVLACTGRLAVLGDEFHCEPALIGQRVAAPIGGACVFGEIAKNERDVDAFFNTTAVVIAFGT
jgi:hypothetical protein